MRAITKLLNSTCIQELEHALFCYNSLTVTKGKNLNLVVD